MLVVDAVCVSFGRKVVLKGVCASFGPGVSALIGLNGEGKTTLFRTVAGILRPISGSVTFNGAAVSGDAAGPLVRFAPQFTPATKSLTAAQLLTYLAHLDGLDRSQVPGRIASALAVVGLSEAANTLTADLSGGMAKRLSIAQSLLVQSPVLLLDEPTSGLDPVQRESVGALISELGERYTVVFSTHDMGEVITLAHSYHCLRGGGIVASGPTTHCTETDLREVIRRGTSGQQAKR